MLKIDGLMQERRNSIANALDLRLSDINPSKWSLLRSLLNWSAWHNANRPISQIPQCTSPVAHNAPFCNKNVHMCGIFDWCIVELWDGSIALWWPWQNCGISMQLYPPWLYKAMLFHYQKCQICFIWYLCVWIIYYIQVYWSTTLVPFTKKINVHYINIQRNQWKFCIFIEAQNEADFQVQSVENCHI